MEHILVIIQYWVILQLITIFILFLFYQITSKSLVYFKKRHERKVAKINQLLKELVAEPNNLNRKTIRFFKRSLLKLIICLSEADEKYQNNKNWEIVKKNLFETVLKKKIKRLIYSSGWFKKYLALQVYELGMKVENEKPLLTLLKNKTLLVSVNAAIVLLDEPTAIAVNAVIDEFSKRRHILQNTFITMLMDKLKSDEKLIKEIIYERLKIEKNIYKKTFCYRLLIALKPDKGIESVAEKDLESDNIDLKIIVLKYLSYLNPADFKPILLRYLNDPSYQVRATVIKLLGNTGDTSLIPLFQEKLRDKEWWVRINSAQALVNLGDTGVAILKEQSAEQDKFAYETAQAFLKIDKL